MKRFETKIKKEKKRHNEMSERTTSQSVAIWMHFTVTAINSNRNIVVAIVVIVHNRRDDERENN